MFHYVQVNEDFVRLAEAYFYTKYAVDGADNMLRSALMEPKARGKDIDVEHERIVVKCLKLVSKVINSCAVVYTNSCKPQGPHRAFSFSLSLSLSSPPPPP